MTPLPENLWFSSMRYDTIYVLFIYVVGFIGEPIHWVSYGGSLLGHEDPQTNEYRNVHINGWYHRPNYRPPPLPLNIIGPTGLEPSPWGVKQLQYSDPNLSATGARLRIDDGKYISFFTLYKNAPRCLPISPIYNQSRNDRLWFLKQPIKVP